jgi:hypothetical protein
LLSKHPSFHGIYIRRPEALVDHSKQIKYLCQARRTNQAYRM